jgi:Family of unknown function (DUF6418)
MTYYPSRPSHESARIGIAPAELSRSLMSLGMVLVGLIFAIAASVLAAPICNYLAVVLFLCFAFHLMAVRPTAFIAMLPLIAMRLTEISACLAIEQGAYIKELEQAGGYTGATARLIFFYLTFFFVAGLAIPEVSRQWSPIGDPAKGTKQLNGIKLNKLYFWFVATLTLASMLYAISIGLREGFPLLNGQDRFAFRSQVSDSYFGDVMGSRYILILVLAMYEGELKKYASGLIILIFVVSMLFGEKFTSITIMLLTSIIPSSLRYIVRHAKFPVVRVMTVFFAIIAVTIPIILLVYGAKSDLASAQTGFLDRAAAQGSMWYVVDRDYGSLVAFDAKSAVADITTWLIPGHEVRSGTGSGLYYVMGRYLSDEQLSYAMDYSVGSIFALYPYWLIVSGYLGVFVVILGSAAIYGLVCRLVIEGVRRGSIILASLSEKALSLIYGGFFTGYSSLIFGWKPLLTITIALVLRQFALRQTHPLRAPRYAQRGREGYGKGTAISSSK